MYTYVCNEYIFVCVYEEYVYVHTPNAAQPNSTKRGWTARDAVRMKQHTHTLTHTDTHTLSHSHTLTHTLTHTHTHSHTLTRTVRDAVRMKQHTHRHTHPHTH